MTQNEPRPQALASNKLLAPNKTLAPKVKICGITCLEDALLAADLGADWIGLNFYPPSPRYVSPAVARHIADAVRGRLSLVGVFVNEPEAAEIAQEVGLDLLQFHGDESPDELAPHGDRAIKVFRVRESFDPALMDPYPEVWGFLVDTKHPSLYGGSGESWRFSSLRGSRRPKPIFIAGGLGPDNVAAAVATAQPFAIDVCSGVEKTPGVKDPERLRRLFEEISHGQDPTSP